MRLEVSLGRESVTVPDVAQRTRNDAVLALEEAGLVLGEVQLEISDEVPVGVVIRQSPAPEESVPPFTEVDLVVSGESTAVPNLDKLTIELARVTLAASGLQLGEVSQRESEVDGGLVLEQSLPEGARVLWGTTVDIVVSATDQIVHSLVVNCNITIEENGTTVRALLSDGESEREVFRTVMNAGEYSLDITLDSMKPGEQVMRLYAGEELKDEQTVVFGGE